VGFHAYALIGVVELDPRDAINDSRWKESIEKEISALIANNTGRCCRRKT
jgi:hypothetical protein